MQQFKRTSIRLVIGGALIAGCVTTGTAALTSVAVAAQIRLPAGYTPLFNGKDLTGWHISRTTHHGATGNYYVENGVLMMGQRPFGQGGLLFADKFYKDFDLYLELNPDAGFNSGVFLRSTESGSGYQVEVVAPGESTGNLIGERMRVSQPQYIGEKKSVMTVWNTGEWNSMRIRMVGEAPHVTVWVNDTQLYELQMPKNDQIAGVYGGLIGLQLHWTATYSPASGSGTGTRPWERQRYRNIGIKEIK